MAKFMMRDPPLKFKSKAKKGTMKGSKEHSEIFDVGDTVYSVSEFEKVAGKYFMQDAVPPNIVENIRKKGFGDNVEIPGVNMSEFKKVFKKVLEDYHTEQAKGSKPSESAAEYEVAAKIQETTAAAQPQQSVADGLTSGKSTRASTSAAQPSTKTEKKPAEPKVVGPANLEIEQLKMALSRARKLRMQLMRSSSLDGKETGKNGKVFVDEDREIREEFGLETSALKTHFVKSDRLRESLDTRFGMIDVQKVSREKKSSVRQVRVADRLLAFVEQLHSQREVFKGQALNEAIMFTKVIPTRDLKRAVVYWTFSDDDFKASFDMPRMDLLMQKSLPMLRSRAAKVLNMKYTPEFVFRFDEHEESTQDLDRIIHHIITTEILPDKEAFLSAVHEVRDSEASHQKVLEERKDRSVRRKAKNSRRKNDDEELVEQAL